MGLPLPPAQASTCRRLAAAAQAVPQSGRTQWLPRLSPPHLRPPLAAVCLGKLSCGTPHHGREASAPQHASCITRCAQQHIIHTRQPLCRLRQHRSLNPNACRLGWDSSLSPYACTAPATAGAHVSAPSGLALSG